MNEFIGAGGWDYFDVPGADRLAAYATAFPFVEVNATFYMWPDPPSATAWRKRVPAGFQFAIRTHRELTHLHRLRATPGARSSLARTAKLAKRLRAIAIVAETPASVVPDAREFTDLLATVDLPCPVALEARHFRDRELPAPLAAAMEDNDVADAVDFSRQSSRTESTIAYGRLFGLGDGNRWEFTTDELAVIRERGDTMGASRVAYAFHGVRMYKDAGRFLTYVRTGKAPPATRHRGLRSLEEVLSADARFPAGRGDLIREHGFRVVDGLEGGESHARDLLLDLPAGPFRSATEVAQRLTNEALARAR